MTTGEQPSLRERKKTRTRETVRREAFRLFELNGYAQTTVDQIAEAADVSPRTFFRYFPTKESVLFSDDLLTPIIEAFLAAPAELSPVAAYRHAAAQVFAAMAGPDFDYVIARQRLLYALPEAKGALWNEHVKAIRVLTTAIAERLDRPEDDQVRVTAGAIIGVFMAASDDAPLDGEAFLQALDILETGLPE
ncbi:MULTISPECIES: TetR family transcriptional regulator [Mycolicibacterium]|jgi:AcrR family transcriptional regulator|uniref:Transcriptional regulator, TetR family n=2 Tax=Mycolicibacterium TaxID=1866885 RepID=A1T232_MYCVP|nr:MULTISPECIES: TetR family transcriptional regulator [Mycolicibacterium]ABM11232.1 transcriptional regulator, TetR family [Mycolicibacterium vanbaalenii PYR-1]MCV7128666.1 TetR family transcriptional regulator [Mycolicibacterium vanbaalenii PYR-1]MDN4516700.1 TetR family transcriptional regulator [Mycolicibacterium austroafricanum]QRZ07261.1 TetR family transcriptional regulator [Mycolicibacterium austroafricanum]QZT68923.1 TetR family transcriptional regulator [Mycolicibacterium austroafric